MGCGTSKEVAEQKATNVQIDAKIKKDKAEQWKEVKMLLLGTGESGKSTILKQMTLIHGPGYSVAEKLSFKIIIFSNIGQSMRTILEAMEKLSIPLDECNAVFKEVVMELPSQITTEDMDPAVAKAVASLWLDPGVQACYSRSPEYQLNDSAAYYFDALSRICAATYQPTEQDVLRSRVKTTGIIETKFIVGKLTYRMFDVGGQRNERKKWIHSFEGVTSILFLVAVSEYDQVLIEDETMNRMQEALILFDSICNSRWFVATSIILFLNKVDLFKTKLLKTPLTKYFPEYVGDNDFFSAGTFFTEKFKGLNQNEAKDVYSHFTCATDTNQVKFVMAAVNDIITRGNLKDVGVL